MSAAPHLVACVASHGWGHLSQTIPIVGALHARIPGLRTTVRTGLPAALVRPRFEAEGVPAPDVSADDTEFGFAMRDALHVDDDASLARYRLLFDERDARLGRERDALRALRADVVLANIGWLPLAAAASLGLPAFGACSLNWADLLAARFGAHADVAPIVRWMRDGYDRAERLFALTPGMPFDGFANRLRVEPIARHGAARADALRDALGVPRATRLMLVSFGGLPLRVDSGHWRLPDGWHALVLAPGEGGGPTSRALPPTFSYLDAMASSDLLVAKPGYGTFAEAGFAARDTAWVPRDDWPEAPHLVDWLAGHARIARIELDAVRAGAFDAALAAIDAQPARVAARGDGAARIADHIAGHIAEHLAARLGVAPVSRPGTGARTGG